MKRAEKIAMLRTATAAMQSSLTLCLDTAERCIARGDVDDAERCIEKAAQYAWGGNRPADWNDNEPPANANLWDWLVEQGATYGVGLDRTGQRRHGWWLDGTYIGDTARHAVSAIRG